ncbi:MAG TPA: DEAD/DEAH box helicase family protein, partial [Candidatus Paceibacterota bacterium]|nr:DEAD/DEAH box helicase family protein [Candidatus Paceibacterota bacterium]
MDPTYHRLSLPVLREHFPSTAHYRRPWKVQEEMLAFVAGEITKAKVAGDEALTTIIESGTGTGKTAVEYTLLRAAEAKGGKTLFLITPNKTLVDQIRKEFPGLKVALGRNEHPCLYYPDEELRADEIPCSLLQDCPHRVNQETGATHES